MEKIKRIDGEKWRPVAEYPRYMVSSEGRVLSKKGKVPLLLKLHPNDKGYMRVMISYKGKCLKRRVHRLVLKAFIGDCPDGYECGHLDGDPANNRLDNLKWVSQLENDRSKDKHGTSNRKLNVEQVLEIRERAKKGETAFKMAKDYPVSDRTINGVIKRDHWKHV